MVVVIAPIWGLFYGLIMKNNLESFLTTKHQLHLILQVLDEWILPSDNFDEYDKAALISASDLISTVHTSLECKFQENLKVNFYE